MTVVSPRALSASATRDRLLEGAERAFLEKGYALTSVEEICSAAGTTKGAFFHHFTNKEDLALATLRRFAQARLASMQAGAGAWPTEPVERVLAYVEDVRRASVERAPPRGCLIAIILMELGATHEVFREKCGEYLRVWAELVRELLRPALESRGVDGAAAGALADYFIAIFEGSVVLARARGDFGIFAQNLALYAAHLELLLGMTRDATERGLARARRT